MKVLQVNKLYYPHIGGVENHVRTLAAGLKDRVSISVLVANERLRTVVEDIDGVKVTRVASLGRLSSAPLAPGFITRLKKVKADIYHCHFPNPTGEISFLLARPRGKLIVTYHSDIVRQRELLRFYRPLLEKFLGRADVILASSPNLINGSPFLQKVKEKCRVIPLGIQADWLTPTPEIEKRVAEIRQKQGPKIAFFLGRLIYYKGLEYLIRAMRDVNGSLVIAGEGELGPELKALADNLRVKDRVEFVGALPNAELAAYYHACDVFVLPSVEPSEAYGLVQLEAHACGKPVVSTNLPTGVPFVNQDGVTGLVVPPKDTLALSKAVNELLNNVELRMRLGSQAQRRFKSDFTSEVMINRVYDLYCEILGLGRA